MADLKRKLHILQHLSPAISEKQPRTQTKCGGLLMMTLFPIAVVIYSLVWFNNCKPRHSPATSRRPARPRLSACNWRGQVLDPKYTR